MDEQATFEPQAVLTRRRAGRNRLLLVVPVLAIAATAWAGLSGRESSSERAADVVPVPVGSTSPTELIARAPALEPGIAIPLWPGQVLGIHVRGLGEVAAAELSDDAVIAVAGWYEASSITACPTESDIIRPGSATELGVVSDGQTFCRRSGLLFAASPEARTGGTATYRSENGFKNTQLPATLGVGMRPGIIVPPRLVRGGEEATPVVLIGRVGWPFDGCAKFVTRCRQQLLVDRVIWADGLGRPQTTSILPSLLDPVPQLSRRSRDRLAEASIGPTGTILMETLVDMPTLAAVDPDAAAQVASTSPDAQRIWYRRTLGLDPLRDAPRWIAFDDATGQVVGSGIVGVRPGPRLPADGVNVIIGGAPPN